MFNVSRLDVARKRRRLTSKALAENSGLTAVTVSRILNGKQKPDPSTQDLLADAVGFPRSFFEQDDLDSVSVQTASFRSLSSMTARERDAALSAGSIAFEISDWLNERYELPETDLPDFDYQVDPETAAQTLRQHWAIGEKPIGNLVKFLEAKGIRIFSLSESGKRVDAFSLWRNSEPFIFLNNMKTAERSRFDAAHELGHLVLHKHGGPSHRSAEREANMFASAFLMPRYDVTARIPNVYSLRQIIDEKTRWRVSAAALCYRLRTLETISEWHHRTFNIQLRQRFGVNEPNGADRDTSGVWKMVFEDLWRLGRDRGYIARELSIPESELENLVFGLLDEINTRGEEFAPFTLKLVQ